MATIDRSTEETGLGFGIIDGVEISRGTLYEWKPEPVFIEYPYQFDAGKQVKSKKIREKAKRFLKKMRLLDPSHFYSKEYYNSKGKNIRLKYFPHTRYRNMVKAINL